VELFETGITAPYARQTLHGCPSKTKIGSGDEKGGQKRLSRRNSRVARGKQLPAGTFGAGTASAWPVLSIAP